MKKIILLALAFAPITILAQSGNFLLTGKVGSYNAPAKIFLLYFQGDKRVRDSAVVDHGIFHIQAPLIQPVRALLVFDHSGKGADAARYEKNSDQIILCLENGNIHITAKDSVKNGVVTGSKLNDEFLKYTASLAGPNQTIKAIKDEYAAVPADKKKDKAFRIEMDTKSVAANEHKKEVQRQFIRQNPDSYISILALSELAGYSVGAVNISAVEPLYEGLSANVRNTVEGADFAKLISVAKSIAIGAMAPVFTQNDVNGNPVSLESFRGKYVFIDFWASWSSSSEDSPNLVKLYDKYKTKKFTIIGVGLEQPGKKDEWLAAIKAGGLLWTQVTDFKLWKNEAAILYHIVYLPSNYLIDPAGKIIAKNLYSEKLSEKLEDILGK